MPSLDKILSLLKAITPGAILGFILLLKRQKDNAVAEKETSDLKIKEMEISSEVTAKHINELPSDTISEYLSKFEDTKPDSKP